MLSTAKLFLFTIFKIFFCIFCQCEFFWQTQNEDAITYYCLNSHNIIALAKPRQMTRIALLLVSAFLVPMFFIKSSWCSDNILCISIKMLILLLCFPLTYIKIQSRSFWVHQTFSIHKLKICATGNTIIHSVYSFGINFINTTIPQFLIIHNTLICWFQSNGTGIHF